MKQIVSLISYFLLYIGFAVASVQAQWVDMRIPVNGSVKAVAVKDSLVFASAAEGRMLIANTNTNQWTEPTSNLTGKLVNTFLVHDTTIYAGTTSGIFQTTDNGINWSPIGSPVISPHSLCVYDSTFYASTSSGVYSSKDNGLTWERFSLYKRAKGVLLNNKRLFCITAEDGLFVSDDSGKTWRVDQNGITTATLSAIISHEGDLYISTLGSGVFRSSDDGASWVLANTGLSNFDVLAFESNGDVIFGGTYGGGVYASNSKGKVWVPVNTGITHFHAYSFAKDDSTLFMATGNSGVWRRPLRQFINLKYGVHIPEPNTLSMSCFPNPFNTSTTISYKLDNSEEVLVEVYDVLGRKVQTIVNDRIDAGEQSISFNAATLPEGMYYAKLKTSSAQPQIKMVLSK